jgi:hypothetical protein
MSAMRRLARITIRRSHYGVGIGLGWQDTYTLQMLASDLLAVAGLYRLAYRLDDDRRRQRRLRVGS